MNEGRQYTRRYEEHIYQQVQLSGIEQVSRIEKLSFDRIQGILKHQYTQKKLRGGQELSDWDQRNRQTERAPKLSHGYRGH